MSQYLDLDCRFVKENEIIDIAIHQGGRSLPYEPEVVSNLIFKIMRNMEFAEVFCILDVDSYSSEDTEEYNRTNGKEPESFYNDNFSSLTLGDKNYKFSLMCENLSEGSLESLKKHFKKEFDFSL